MKRIQLLLAATILILGCATLLPAPTSLPNPTPGTPNVLPDTTDPSRPITVKAGDTFEIVLASNSSTGYRWKFIGELDENIVQLVGQDSIAQQPVMPGSGGVDVWTFQAVNPGDTTVVLGYYPPASETEPAQTVTFTIHVE